MRRTSRRFYFAWIIISSGMLASGAQPAAADTAATARPLGRETPVVEVSRDPDVPVPDRPAPAGSIALAEALAAALVGSPSLAATAYGVRQREALAIQAGLLPNPTLSLDAEDFVGPSQRKSLGFQQTTLSLAQLVELGGKRGARRRLADRERDLATWEFESQRIAVLTDTTKAFLLVLALQERQVLLGELERLAGEMLRSVASTVRAGAVSPVEEDRAQVNLDRVRLDAAQVENDLATARSLLAASWGQATPTFAVATGDLWTLPPTPDPEALSIAVEDGPELARWNAEIAQREAVLAVERAARVPSVEISLAGRHHELGDKGGVVAGLSIPVPLFDRNQGNILAARQRLVRAFAEQRQADASVRSTLVASQQAFVVASRRVSTLRDQIIPRANRVFDKTRQGYATGLFRYVEVLDAQRTLFDARRELLDAVLTLHFTATDLEQLTGTPLDQLSQRSKS